MRPTTSFQASWRDCRCRMPLGVSGNGVGQNRPDADRTGMINGLLQESDESAEALAAFMREADL